MITTPNDRIQSNTTESINEEIEKKLRDNIRYYSAQGTEALSKRIDDLEKEWYMERVLITNASAFASIGLILGFTVHRKWLIIPGVALGFLLQYGLQGWSLPLPLFRLLGVRSFKEIDKERYALKILRGDFTNAKFDIPFGPDQVFEALRK